MHFVIGGDKHAISTGPKVEVKEILSESEQHHDYEPLITLIEKHIQFKVEFSYVKVKLSLCLTKYYAMKTDWGVEV
jgi:hypothetical protein